jgi:glycosyltransferase involved in cell wall biosynthesis
LLSEVDVMVLPSYREGLSKSLIEAAAMSLPIITTDVPGCREVVEHKFNGILCQAKSMSSLENAISEMILLSNETRHSMGLKGRLKIIDTFSNTIVIKTYLQQIKDIFTHQNLNHEN